MHTRPAFFGLQTRSQHWQGRQWQITKDPKQGRMCRVGDNLAALQCTPLLSGHCVRLLHGLQPNRQLETASHVRLADSPACCSLGRATLSPWRLRRLLWSKICHGLRSTAPDCVSSRMLSRSCLRTLVGCRFALLHLLPHKPANYPENSARLEGHVAAACVSLCGLAPFAAISTHKNANQRTLKKPSVTCNTKQMQVAQTDRVSSDTGRPACTPAARRKAAAHSHAAAPPLQSESVPG